MDTSKKKEPDADNRGSLANRMKHLDGDADDKGIIAKYTKMMRDKRRKK